VSSPQRAVSEYVNSALTEAASAKEAEDMVKQEVEVAEELRVVEWKLRDERQKDRTTTDALSALLPQVAA